MVPSLHHLSVLALLLLPLSVFPSAHAALPACVDAADLSTSELHVVENGIRSELWHETNGLQGLQMTDCHADGLVHSADTFLVMVPHDLGLLGVCTFFVIGQCF